MTLNEQLSELKDRNCASLSDEINEVMAEAIRRLSESELVGNAPRSGDRMRDFSLFNHLGKKRSLADFRDKGPVVVSFYRGGWCPYCNLQLRAYQSVLSDIYSAGATLVAVTPEFPDGSLSTREKNELEFEVVSDINSNYARELGLVYTLPKKLRSIYAGFGIDIEKYNGVGQFDLPLTATYIVDTDGTIVSAFVRADYTLRKEPAELVRELGELVKQKALYGTQGKGLLVSE